MNSATVSIDPLKRKLTDQRLSSILQAWELLRTRHHELPAQAVTVFLYVASHDPCHKQSIEEDQGLTTASCSRMIDVLNKGPARPGIKTKGLGLVEKYSDPSNGRRFLIRLTPEGEDLADQLKTTIYG